jgi:hypothetical protein
LNSGGTPRRGRARGALRTNSVRWPALALSAVALAFAGCGDDDDSDTTTTSAGGETDLSAVKDYLTAHTTELAAATETMQELGNRYYELAESEDFDYQKLMDEHGDEVAKLMKESKAVFDEANPAYEEMEGIVAGVPRLAQYDVDIDAGSDSSDPENAVSFSLELPNGKTLKQPGNAFFVTETALYGTDPKFLAKDVKQDVDGDGKEEFGEGVPDAGIYKAMVDKFAELASDLDADAQEFDPTTSDAFTAITVMTPTMSEYFEAWKNTRFVAGAEATDPAFVARSRLHDIADILEGLVLTYDQVEPLIAQESKAQAEQTGKALNDLLAFVEDLRDREDAGEQFTAEQADTLGSEAQSQAEAIAGQVTQAAKRLNVELQA